MLVGEKAAYFSANLSVFFSDHRNFTHLLDSPLLENIVHLPPRDLWPNAETFLKQMRDKARRGPGGGPAPTPNAAAMLHMGNNLPTGTNAGRAGAVSFGGTTLERPPSSGGKGGLLPNLHTNRSGDDDYSNDEISPLNATSGGGKKFFGTGSTTPAAQSTTTSSGANTPGFGAADANASANAKKSTPASSGKPPVNKERKRSAVPATTTPTATLQKPGSAKRTTS